MFIGRTLQALGFFALCTSAAIPRVSPKTNRSDFAPPMRFAGERVQRESAYRDWIAEIYKDSRNAPSVRALGAPDSARETSLYSISSPEVSSGASTAHGRYRVIFTESHTEREPSGDSIVASPYVRNSLIRVDPVRVASASDQHSSKGFAALGRLSLNTGDKHGLISATPEYLTHTSAPWADESHLLRRGTMLNEFSEQPVSFSSIFPVSPRDQTRSFQLRLNP